MSSNGLPRIFPRALRTAIGTEAIGNTLPAVCDLGYLFGLSGGDFKGLSRDYNVVAVIAAGNLAAVATMTEGLSPV